MRNIAFNLLFTLIAFIAWSIALMLNWNWFMVPFGLPVISFFWAGGIFIVFACLLGDTAADIYATYNMVQKNELQDCRRTFVVSSLVRPTFFAVYGYIIHLLLTMTL